MAYNPNTHIISAPVSIYDLQRAVPVTLRRTNSNTGQVETVSSNDLGVLCAAVVGDTIPANDGYGSWTVISRIKINMWARFRPVEYKSNGRSGSVWVNQVPDSGTPSRVSVAFGIINIPVWNDRVIGQMLNFWSEYDTTSPNRPTYIDENGQTTSDPLINADYWKMKLPTSAFRLTDFVSTDDPTTKGYYTFAEAPISGLTATSIAITPKGLLDILYTKNEAGVSAGLTIRYEDLQYANNAFSWNYYFGVALVKFVNGNPTNTRYYLTAASQMSSFQEMGAVVRGYVTNEQFPGTYLAFPFISSELLVGSASEADPNHYSLCTDNNVRGIYIALLDHQELAITINYAKIVFVQIYVWYDLTQSTRLINYDITLTNTEADIAREYTLDITFFKSDGVTQLYTKSIPNLSIAAGATIHVEGSQDMAQYGGPDLVGAARAITTVTSNGVIFKHTDSIVTNTIYDHEPIIP